MSNTTILAAVVCLLLGAAVGWFAREPGSESPEPVPHTEPAEDRGASDEIGLEADGEFAVERIQQLESQLKEAFTERDSLKQALADAAAGKVSAQDEVARIAAAAELKGPRYTYEGLEKTLKEIKWDKIAKAVVGMAGPMKELGEALAAGRPAGDLPQKVQKFNMPLIQAAVAANQGGMPGHGINGSFTHPALVANLIYSTLVEAGLPLDDAQAEKLSQLADRSVEDDRRLRAARTDESWAMEQLVMESEMKDRFYKAVDSLLTPEQVEVLHPGALRDRTAGDIFSAGLIWMQSAQVARARDREDLTQKITAGLMRRLQIPEEEKEAVGRAVGDWAAKFGPDAFTPLDDLEKSNMVRMDRIRAAGRPMVDLYKEIARSLPGQEEVIKRLRETAFLVVPAGL